MAKGNYTSKVAQNVNTFVETKKEEAAVNKPAAKESKVGRPSKGEVKKITLAIPVELLEDIDVAAMFHKGNKTAYINNLIKKDLEENLEKYKEFKKMMEQI